ncbi:hypothetical protein F7725_009069 [Dissostichus mawsoni]|uniref:Uncharacterized protein n=1 Tax=Dissostichus mawsoni TaxID=36200 RepID=A0A7J5Z6I0_DISMA|nr:hypothetical protein F7725_009069 [Dissostichus mawsoni]
MREEWGSQRRFLSVWVALSRVESQVFPLLYPWILLSFLPSVPPLTRAQRPRPPPGPCAGAQQPALLPLVPPSRSASPRRSEAGRLAAPPAGQRGDHYYEAAGGRVDGYRQASPGRYSSPERHPDTGERYRDDRQPDQKRKNPLIGAV